MRSPVPLSRRLDDAALLLIAACAQGSSTVDDLGRPKRIEVYDGSDKLVVTIRWVRGVPQISDRTSRALHQWFETGAPKP